MSSTFAGRHTAYRTASTTELLDKPAVIEMREGSDVIEELCQRIEDHLEKMDNASLRKGQGAAR